MPPAYRRDNAGSLTFLDYIGIETDTVSGSDPITLSNGLWADGYFDGIPRWLFLGALDNAGNTANLTRSRYTDGVGNEHVLGPYLFKVVAPVWLAKRVEPVQVGLGGTVTYTLLVQNLNAEPISTIMVTDALQTGVTALQTVETPYITQPDGTLA